MKHLYKIVQGNHTCIAAESDEKEAQLRSDGYMLAEELWPAFTPNDDLLSAGAIFDKPKRRVSGRNSA